MSNTSFSLVPFPGNPPPVSLKIGGSLRRYGNMMHIFIQVAGDHMDRIRIPALIESPARIYGLWEQTCFELFLAPLESCQYWEFNLSPSGAWNVYRFNAYREGMLQEPAFSALPFQVNRHQTSFSISLDFDSRNLFGPQLVIAAGICAVIEDKNGVKSYWALTHTAGKPDFHARKSFTIEY